MGNFLDKINERVSEAKTKLRGVLNTVPVPIEVKTQRLTICAACEYFFEPTYQCRKCGCLLKVKSELSSMMCPINKWGEYKDPNSDV